MALETGSVTALAYNPERPSGASLILAHGAGAGQRSPFMTSFARGLAGLGLRVVTFDFPYTQQRRTIPDRGPVLEACYTSVIAAVRRDVTGDAPLCIGGKSMGGRIATQVAANDDALAMAGLVLLGYPLHPPGRPDSRRDAHLPRVRRPMLFVQGSRDAFGTPAELAPILETLSPRPMLHVVDGGDHSFKVSKTSGGARAGDAADRQAAVYDDVQRTIARWIDGLNGPTARASRSDIR